MKKFNGKAIYEPSGKAAEYSPWACNFYTGCSNDCDYCYCKRGVMAHVWDTTPRLKKCFKDEEHAIEIFYRELMDNLGQLREKGLLFSFTTDPMLPETCLLTLTAARIANDNAVPIKILTKRGAKDNSFGLVRTNPFNTPSLVAFGFTLTGADELEPGAAPNRERIEAMIELRDQGYKTFASIEPVINPSTAKGIILGTLDYCDLYKVGLISGKGKDFYKSGQVKSLWCWLEEVASKGYKIYPKDSLLAYMGVNRADLKHFVTADYNLFKD